MKTSMLRKFRLGTTAALALTWSAATSAAQPAAPANAQPGGPYASAFDGQRQTYVMLIRLRHDLWLRYRRTGTWPADREADAALGGHVAYWRRQLATGAALFAGSMDGDFWDNSSIIVFEASSLAAAQAIVDADPAVQALIFQAQVRPFTAFWMTDRFRGQARSRPSE